MKIIYAKKSSGINEQGSFQNPEYYDKPSVIAESVVIYGDYPEIKADYEKLGVEVDVRDLPKAKPLMIDVKVGITPELQQVIDEAKAECEKVIAENEVLKEQIIVLENGKKEYSDLISENSRLKDQLTLSEKNADELQTVIHSLNKTVAELESKPKKPTAAELKAAKTAEETKISEQPKE